MNTKILVCCHKQAELPHDTNFMPIHVGKKLSKQALGMTGDDSGDNISELNLSSASLPHNTGRGRISLA